MVDIGVNAKTVYMRYAASLDENGLPNATGCGVPSPLFTDWLLGVVHRVLHTKNKQSGAGAVRLEVEDIGKVELKWGISAFVPA